MRSLTVAIERFPLARPFAIARGTREATEVITVTLREDGQIGRGEGVPYARYGETPASALAAIEGVRDAVERGMTREALQGVLPAGAARNALDCALWDLEARRRGTSVQTMLGLAPAGPLRGALTIGIDTPEAMGTAAAKLRGAPLVKVKLGHDRPAERLRAVRAALPEARLIVDANESWDRVLLGALQPLLAELEVEFVEQPLPAEADMALEGLRTLVPLCADESCHVAADIERLAGRYQFVNIKLDKTGGLTGALELLEAARAAKMKVMLGCMVSTSLSIAAAWPVAAQADWVDCDGPWWLHEDRQGGVRFEEGRVLPAEPGFWGSA